MSERLCKISEVPASGKEVHVTGDGEAFYLMLFIVDNEVHAYRNRCPHQHRNLNWAPDRFIIDANQHLVCAHHGAVFDLRDGICTQGPCKGANLTAVSISVTGDEIWLD